MAKSMNVHGSWGYHKGYVGDKYTFSVLAIDKLDKDEKEKIRAAIKPLATGQEAQTKIGDGWAYELLDSRGRVGLLKKNGVEVALFFQRQIVQVQPGPGDPRPERPLEDMAEAWQRLDLIGPSAKQANRFIKGEIDQLREKSGLLEMRCQNLEGLVATLETDLANAQTTIENMNVRLRDWQKKGRVSILNQARALAGPQKKGGK